jgi:hypothetical protein
MTHRFASRRIRISRGTHDTRRFRNASCLERPPLGPWRCRGNAGGEVESSSTFGFGQSEPPGRCLRTRNLVTPGAHESIVALLHHHFTNSRDPYSFASTIGARYLDATSLRM